MTTLEIIVRQIKLDFLSKNNTKGLELKTSAGVTEYQILCIFWQCALSNQETIHKSLTLMFQKSKDDLGNSTVSILVSEQGTLQVYS